MPHETDALVGRLALEKGFLTPGQLQECLAEQAEREKSGVTRPLGVIMVSRGMLQDAQLLELLEEQKKMLAERSETAHARKEDAFFGQILVRQGLLTAEQIRQALRAQARAAERGEPTVPRLGQILVEQGVSDEKTLQQALQLQSKTLYACPGCSLTYNIVSARSDRRYRCRKCGAILAARPPGAGLRADQSAYAVKLEVSEDLPPEVVEAEKDPANLFDKYVLIREIGRGGMGTVYKAYQKDLQRTLAVKVLRGDDPENLERFTQEAQTAARLKHPHIVSLYEIGKAGDTPFLAMEHIDGPPLSEARKLPVRKICAVLRDVAAAVHYAHEKGIIHRDLKPANILLDREGRAYVTDFGLARQIRGGRNLTSGGMIVGTPAYMSPEQARGLRRLDRQSDVASLGSVMFELLTGQPPYAGKTPMDVALAVINQDPLPPGRINPAVSPELEAVCLKAMDKRKARRYRTARALAEDLQRYLEGEPVHARRPGLVTVAMARLGRSKVPNAVSIPALVLLVVMAGLLVGFWRQSRSHAAIIEGKTLENSGDLHAALRAYEQAGADGEASRVRGVLRERGLEHRPPAQAAGRVRALEILSRARAAEKPGERIALASKAIDADPELEEAYAFRAASYEALGFLEATYADLVRATLYSQAPLPHYVRRADVARRMNRVQDQISDLSQAIKLDGTSAELHQHRAAARFVAQDFAGAAGDWERAVALDAALRRTLEPRIRQARLKAKN